MFQLTHPYMTAGKTIVLTRWTFVGKVMSLIFNMLSRLIIAIISWLQSPSAVILEPQKIVSCCFHYFPIYLPQWTGSKLGKKYIKGVYCHSAYLTFARRSINNLRYADDITLMAESEEELKSVLIRVKKEREKAGLKLNVKKRMIMALGPITSRQIEGEKVEAVTDFIFLGFKTTADGDCSHET